MSAAQSTSDRIRDFVWAKFPLARKRAIKEGEPLLDGGIVDSMGILEVVHFIEQEFSIQVSDEELVPENFQSIDRLVSFVQSKTSRIGR